MSSAIPPFPYFNGITYNPSLFSSSTDYITATSGKKLFLSYPTAQGEETFASNVLIKSSLTDKSGSKGTSGQLLSSTGSGVNWITSGNGYLSLNVSILPYTLPIPSYTNLYIIFTGTGSGILTIPTTGVPIGTFINIKCLQNGSVSLSTSYILYSNTNVQSTYLGIDTFSAYFNGSAWVQTSISNRTDNLTITNTLSLTGGFATNTLVMASSGVDIDLYGTTTVNDILIGQTLPIGKTLRLCNTTAGAAGALVNCSNISFDGSNINNATAPTTGLIKFANSQTTGALYLGCGSTTATRTTGPIFIGSDSTTSGGINIGTGTDLTVPAVNTVNIGSGTYGTIIKGSLTTNVITNTGTISSTGNISSSAGDIESTTGKVKTGTLDAVVDTVAGVTALKIGSNIVLGNIEIGNAQTTGDIIIGSSDVSGATITIGKSATATTINGTLTTGAITATSLATSGNGSLTLGTGAISTVGAITSTGLITSNNSITTTGTGTISTASTGSIKTDTLDSTVSTNALSIGATIAAATTNGISLGTNCLIKMKSPSLTNTGSSPATQAATNMTIYGGLMFSYVSAAYTIPASGTINRDFYIVVTGSGTFTITMPAIAIHQIIHIRNQNSAAINLTAPLAGTRFYPTQTGGGLSTTTYSMPANTAQNFYCDGLDWQGI